MKWMAKLPRTYWLTAAGIAYQMLIVILQHIEKDSSLSDIAKPFILLSALAAGLGAVAMHKTPRPDKWDGEDRRTGFTKDIPLPAKAR